jgi:chorismate-pyruvate lyase
MAESISTKELKSLNSKKGIKQFLYENGSLTKTLRFVKYENRLKVLQEELIKL